MSYDYVIIGGGAGAIMTAYTLNDLDPSKNILILEKNSKTLTEYRNKNYDNIINWQLAQNDTDYTYSQQSTDGKTVWVGEGLGGGTLHFGMQYIDSLDVINKNYSDWSSIFTELDIILNPQQYNYSVNNNPNEAWYNLKQQLDADSSILTHNNKIYSDNLDTKSRLLIGSIVENKQNITIEYGVEVDKLVIQYGKVQKIETVGGTDYSGNKYILAAGAIMSPTILLRSGINAGTSLYDHAGYTLLYKKMSNLWGGDSGYSDSELTTLSLNKYNVGQGGNNDLSTINSGLSGDPITAIFQHTKLSDSDVALAKSGTVPTGSVTLGEGIYYVYDMGTYWSSGSGGHPGGDVIRSQLGTSYELTNTLITQHGQAYSRLFTGGATLLGIKEITTQQQEISDLGLQPNQIVGHLQTRDPSMNWQTYYSSVAGYESRLIVTHAQGAHLSGAGSITLDASNNPIVTLNHLGSGSFKDTTLDYLLEAYTKNNTILINMGYVLDSQAPINKTYIEAAYNSIYHYQGGSVNVIDDNFKVSGVNNLYVGDSSALDEPWAGSTSVPSMALGRKLGKLLTNLTTFIPTTTSTFNYNDELLDMLLKKELGTRYTSASFVFGQELPALTRYQTDMVYASELPTSLESSFEWSDAVNVTDGGTYKILNSVFGEIDPAAYKFIKKYEDIPMVDVSGTNGRAWYPVNKDMREILRDSITGKTNFTFEIETNIQYDQKIYSNNPNYLPIINSGVLVFLGNLKPLTSHVIKLKRVYIYDGEYGAIKDIKLDDMGDALLIDPSNSQPFVYNGAMGQWNEGSIGINFMPIQVLGDFLEVNEEYIDVNSGIFYSNVTNKWEMENLPTLISDMSNVYFSEIDTNWDGVVWKSDASGNRWVNRGLQPPLTSINDLPDVDTSSSLLFNNDGILYNAAQELWMPDEIQLAMTIGSPSDVDLSLLKNGHRLKYNENTDDWNTKIKGPIINVLSDIGDIDMTNLEDLIPQWDMTERIELDSPIENSYYGNSVDINNQYAIIGAYKEDFLSPALANAGKAYIYELGEEYNANLLHETIIPSDKSSDALFGSVVKLDSEKVIVSAPNHLSNKGKVYIYNFSNNYYGSLVGSYYEESISLTASDEADDNHFGCSLATYNNYMIIGANQSSNSSGKGKCYIFKKLGNDWNEIKILEAPTSGDFAGEVGDQYGDSVEINDEFAFVGVPKKSSNKGLVYVYRKDELGNDNWGFKYILKPTTWIDNSFFGKALAVSSTHLFVSSPSTDVSGSICYYNYTDNWGVLNNTVYNETNLIQPVDGSNNDQFGISISTTNNLMVAGASGVDICGNDSGAIYVYRNTNLGYWEQSDKLAETDISSNDEFGISVSIHYKNIIAGSWKNADPSNSGCAYLYNLPEMEGGTKLIIFDENYNRWKAGEVDLGGNGMIIVTRIEHLNDVDIELPNYPLLSNSTLIFKTDIKKWVPGVPNVMLSSLGDIPKVDISGASNNHLLKYSGNDNWTTTFLDDPIDELDDILDVSASTPSSGDGIVYNSETNKWEGRMVDKSLATGVYRSATEPVGTEGNLYYDTSVDVYFGKIEDDWLQIMLNNSPIIFGHPTNAITKISKTITTTTIEIAWDNPLQTDTMFESIYPEDKVDGVFYLPTINDIYFEIKKSDEDFNDIDGILIGGQEKGQKLTQSSGDFMLTNKVLLTNSNDGTDTIERDGLKQVYKMNSFVLESSVTYKARLWLRNSTPASNDYKTFTNLLLL